MRPSRKVLSFVRRHKNALLVPLVISAAVGAALAFSIPVHRQVTKDTLAAVSAQVNGQPKKFSKRALEQVADANEDVDSIIRGSAAYFHPERHFTNEQFVASSTRLKTLKEQIVAKLKADPPNGDEARLLLGQALHTLQDFYSHSNWVEMGNTAINTNLGRNVMSDPATTLQACPTNGSTLGPNGGGGLTSGYYIGNPFTGCGTLPYAGKCYHGDYSTSCRGINKDKSDQGAPGMHAKAVTVATAATKDYVDQILAEIEGNDKAVSALLDLKGTLGFIIDDTGSMGDEINGVKEVVTRIINATRNSPDDQPDNYMLVRFGDPGVGSAFVTQSADALLDAVSGLSAGGGGDCPEMSQTGLLRAIGSAGFNSRLYLFTDATAKDSSLRNEVISQAQEKSARLSYGLTGSCSPIDDAYLRGAAETGGQVFLINQSEVPELFDLIKPQLSGDLMTILSVKGTLSAPRTFDVPVDSSVRRLVVSVSIDSGTGISLRRPTGSLVNPTDPDALVTDIASGRIITIDAPSTGTWRVEISGSGNFSVVAEGNSPVEFYRFEFVRPSGDIHGGLAPIPGQPLAGAEGTAEASVLGPFTTAAFKLVNEAGEAIKNVPLARNFPDAPPDHFVGKFLLPSVPFRVVVTGNDSGGFAYQRTFPTVYRAQVVGVEVTADTAEVVQAGKTSAFSFSVKNLGPAASYSVNVVTTLGTVSGISPTTLNLATGESGTVRFNVSVPADTPEGTSLAVTMTAAKTDDLTVFNSAILNLLVAQPPTVQFSAAKYSATEDVTFVAVAVNRSGDTSGATTVEYSTDNGTASERSDFSVAAGLLRFAPGEVQKSFSVLITEDSLVEGTETAPISLSNPTGASLGPQDTAVLEIKDDASEPASNAIDLPLTFVGQHYHDFLHRQSDPPGLDFWTKIITDCGGVQSCVDRRRVSVSAAFFLSIEFQETGFLVYRFYKSAYGDATSPNVPGTVPVIRIEEFLPDAQELGRNLIVGQGSWQLLLEANKQAFAAEFVKRPRFVAAFPASMTPAQFVDRLRQNTGSALSQAERNALVSELTANNTDAGRASVLRKVAEDADLHRNEFNRAFVLAQYYGYLRRNPDATPDSDFRGWKFWLDKLNSFGGDFIKAEMVKAFLASNEYRQRFGH